MFVTAISVNKSHLFQEKSLILTNMTLCFSIYLTHENKFVLHKWDIIR